MAITIRPYQRNIIDSVRRDWDSGLTDVMVTASTGAGKTAVFLTLIEEISQEQPEARFLILAHRLDLVNQPVERLREYYPHWFEGWTPKVGVVMGDVDEPDRQLTVATIQTLQSKKRLARVLAHGNIDYLIVDENHHVTDKNHYGELVGILRKHNPAMKHLGVTATPIRADGDGLAGVYQKESAHYGIVEMIKSGYLVPIRWLGISTKISLAAVKTIGGDFQAKGLSSVYETANCFDLVVETYKKYACERQAIAFCVTVQGAYDLAETFEKAGISAGAADGTTKKGARSEILNDFRQGRKQVLCNVGLWTEGLDVPETSCILNVRPTKSDGLAMQMIGRALRLYPGKQDALILDFCPEDTRNIAMAGDVLGVPLQKKAYVKEDVEAGEVVGGFTFNGKYNWLEGNPAEIISMELDYLSMSPWAWYLKDDWMTMGLGESNDKITRTLAISPPRDGKQNLYMTWKKPDEWGWQSTLVKQAGTEIESITAWAEDYCQKRGNSMLAAKTKKWRKEQPSDSQIKYAKTLKGAWKPGMSKGDLAQSITHHLAIRAIKSLPGWRWDE